VTEMPMNFVALKQSHLSSNKKYQWEEETTSPEGWR
jgi:hypothetical protein